MVPFLGASLGRCYHKMENSLLLISAPVFKYYDGNLSLVAQILCNWYYRLR